MACTEIIDDIEDLISSQDITPKERYASRKFVSVRAKKSATTSNHEPEKDQNVDGDSTKKEIQTSVIPGTQKIYVRTWGCSHNSSDSEYMAGQLAAYGYKLTSEKDDADLWLLNSCTVKTPSEQIFLNEINNCLGKGKHLVLAGCVPQGKSKQDFLKDFSIIGVEQIDRVVEVVEETLKGHKVQLLKKRKRFTNNNVEKKVPAVSLDLPKVRKNPLIEIIPINLGCLNQCTYCKTKHARGDLVSYGIEEICARAKQAFDEGCCEIWLTSEDLGTYGRDHDTSLVELVQELVKIVPGHCMIRLGMTNPPYILSLKTGMAELLNHPRIYSFLHIPVQSGSDAVLSDMKREYCREDFEELVDYFREKVPGITIATDIICGFPTETDKDFGETVTLCEKYKFPSLFINQFFPRAGTPAAKMPRVPGDVVKKRTASLTDVFYSYYPYENRVGKMYEVLVTEIAHDKKHYVAHNKCYEQILLPMLDDLLGKSVHVEIISATKFSMTGKVLDPKENWINCSNKKEMQTTNFRISNGKVLKFENTNGFISNDNPKAENNCYWLAATIGLLSLIAYGFVYRALKLFL